MTPIAFRVIDVITSCVTLEQLSTAKRYAQLATEVEMRSLKEPFDWKNSARAYRKAFAKMRVLIRKEGLRFRVVQGEAP